MTMNEGFPVADDRRLFEKICLEGFQSGLSWLTILNKREGFQPRLRTSTRSRSRPSARPMLNAWCRMRPLCATGADRVHPQQRPARAGTAARIRHAGALRLALRACRRRQAGRLTREVARTLSTSPASIALSKDLKSAAGFVGPPRCTPSCRPWGWSTIILKAAMRAPGVAGACRVCRATRLIRVRHRPQHPQRGQRRQPQQRGDPQGCRADAIEQQAEQHWCKAWAARAGTIMSLAPP